jgi:RHS repeat-associated protein
VVDQTGTKTTYSYDTLSRLTGANIYNGAGTHENAFTYAYDAAGNRTSSTQGVTSPGTITYTYNAANELTSRTGNTNGVDYTYDNNGNVTGWVPVSPPITYNAANQMTAFGSTTFSYSGPDQNQRVQVNSTNYAYSGLECDCESNAAGSTYYTHDNSGQLIDERTSTGTYYYLFDGLGSVVGLSDSTGALVGNETYQYDPYGQLIVQPHTAALRTNAWRYASGYYDVSTGLYKFGIRYYDAAIGRWTQRDSVGGSLTETVKVNPYVYAGDDPVNLVDPSGRDAVNCGFAIFFAALAVLAFAIAVAIIVVTLPGSVPIIIGLSVADLSILGAAVGFLGAEGAVFLAYYNGACS